MHSTAAGSSFPGTFHLHCHAPRGFAVPWNAVTFQGSIYFPLSCTALGRGNHGGSKFQISPQGPAQAPSPPRGWEGVSPFQRGAGTGTEPRAPFLSKTTIQLFSTLLLPPYTLPIHSSAHQAFILFLLFLLYWINAKTDQCVEQELKLCQTHSHDDSEGGRENPTRLENNLIS